MLCQWLAMRIQSQRAAAAAVAQVAAQVRSSSQLGAAMSKWGVGNLGLMISPSLTPLQRLLRPPRPRCSPQLSAPLPHLHLLLKPLLLTFLCQGRDFVLCQYKMDGELTHSPGTSISSLMSGEHVHWGVFFQKGGNTNKCTIKLLMRDNS